jgi:Ca-activated chloride channel family protein
MKRFCIHLRQIGLGMGLACSAGSLAQACDLALVLAVDVSGSVDPQEYRIQMDGLAEALRDGIVAEALVDAQAWLTLVQWTGSSRQKTSIAWAQMTTFDDVETFAGRVTNEPRFWRNFSTAIGEALQYSLASFEDVPDCRRKVIDVSGDGASNEGIVPQDVHAALNAEGVTVNAVVIETDAQDLTGYFWENVITGEGAFVMTANGFSQYPDRIRRKLQRETVRQLSHFGEGHQESR